MSRTVDSTMFPQIPPSLLLITTLFIYSSLFLLLSQQVVNSQPLNYDHQEEQRILLKLKNDWGNPPSLNYSWNPSTLPNHCNWKGIACDKVDSFVVLIDLYNRSLTQKIPPIICDLKRLESINLSSNFIPGEFPTYLYNCSRVHTLNLCNNNFQGRIPDDIDRLTSLRVLKLGYNYFSGDVPASVGRFPFLQRLELHYNRFNGSFPPEIGNLMSLEFLYLDFNMFLPSRIPPEFCKLKKLSELSMNGTNLIGKIPEMIADLSNLEKLGLSDNNLYGTIPTSLFLLKNLREVYLSNNNLSGQIPRNLFLTKNLTKVIINDNLLSGEIFSTFESLNLKEIDLSNNRFSGSIPANISRLTDLTYFNASNNLFSGKIPVELTGLPNLGVLSLDGNQLSGEFPSEIISWIYLVNLNLSRNQISGELPINIWSLPSLNVLDLSENQISGELPNEIGDPIRLGFLNLSSNKLTGKLPTLFDYLRFGQSFLNNSGLCATDQIFNLKSCIAKTNTFSPKLLAVVVVIVGATLVLLLLLLLLKLFVLKDICKQKPKQELARWDMRSFQELHFTESNILSNLIENNQIGSGGSGKVYRVPIDHLGHFVAVKMIWSDQSKLDQNMEKQFQAEVQILGTIRHINIVKLLCCISNKVSKLLVYEYMENGSLYQWLHENDSGLSSSNDDRFLDWPRRLRIAVEVAQGLSYMHHNCSPPIIHRDVKSGNILLDSDFKARIADFGLARTLIKQGEPNSASVIAGSFGYIAPEYAHTSKVNEKIDVYSFGVVLLELVTGKEANKGDEHRNLAEWAWSQFQELNSMDVLMDGRVMEECYLEEMRMVFKLGMLCTDTLPSNRPSMKETLQILLRHGSLHPTWALSPSSSPGIQREEE